MALDKVEQGLYDAFCGLDLINPEYNAPFIEFCHNVYNRDYNNRQPIKKLCAKVKNDCMAVIQKGITKTDDEAFNERVSQAGEAMWAILKMEAQHRQFDSYCLYIERYREPRKKFYQPRRKVLRKHGIPQAFQKLIDDEYDLLGISMPPSSGKAQPLYSNVLAPNGFVRMGDVYQGMEVVAGNGNIAHITGIFPQGKKPIYEITLNNKAKCRCSDEHLWKTFRKVGWKDDYLFIYENPSIRTLKQILEEYRKGYEVFFPIYETDNDDIWSRIEKIEYIGEEECQCIMIDDPCHLYITDDYIITHNTTLEKFFHSAVAGWYPQDFSLFYSHSGDITRKYYDDMLNILSNTDEYSWHEIFPDVPIVGTNAKLEEINVGDAKPYSSVQCSSVGASNAGKIRASKYLFVDDLIGNMEQALNKNTLDKLWTAYSGDALQRKTKGSDGIFCKEVIIATRWSVHDPIGRLQRIHEGNERVNFISIPAIDEDTGKSNFEYDKEGFTAEDFHGISEIMDEISFKCLYMQQPIEREGLLYHKDELRRFSDLPNREPDTVLGICDTKTTGIDYMFLPVVYVYGNDFYLWDCVCDNSTEIGKQIQNCANIILENHMEEVEFESNAGGEVIATDVRKIIDENGGFCNIITKPTETHKETRIIDNSHWIKKNMLFRETSQYAKKSDYGKMMDFLLSYTVTGKNVNDDVPDGLALFKKYVERKYMRREAIIVENPFW